MLRSALISVVLVALGTVPARAADAKTEAGPAPLASAVEHAAKEMTPALPAWAVDRPADRRPAMLSVLYGSYAGLQALDVVSTKRALAASAVETNPLLKSGGNARMLAIKAAAGAGTIFFTERAWKKNRVGAIVLMAALNGATAAIVARNMQHAARR
jgi:hypothetical protein